MFPKIRLTLVVSDGFWNMARMSWYILRERGGRLGECFKGGKGREEGLRRDSGSTGDERNVLVFVRLP